MASMVMLKKKTAAEQLARIARRRVDWLIGDKLERTLQNISDFSAQTGYARSTTCKQAIYG